MADEQQALLLALRSIESFLPDLVSLDSSWLPHKAVEMDVSPGKLSAPITEQFLSHSSLARCLSCLW
jgi:hypothetical protein